MRKLLVLLVLLLGLSTTVQAASDSCVGAVIAAPLGLGLPVTTAPSWEAGFTGVNLLPGDQVQVYATHYRPTIGDIWFNIGAGWVQAYSGYTTGFSQVVLGDFPCAQALPHSVGD